MNELDLLHNYLMVGAVLFALGLVGFVVRRNMIVMFLCVEMMLQGVSLSLTACCRGRGWRFELTQFGLAVVYMSNPAASYAVR